MSKTKRAAVAAQAVQLANAGQHNDASELFDTIGVSYIPGDDLDLAVHMALRGPRRAAR